MKSLCQTLLNREIFGNTPTDFEPHWQIRSRLPLTPPIAPNWIQAKDNVLAFITQKGGLVVYNTFTSNSTFATPIKTKVLKAWFYKQSLLMVVQTENEIQVLRILLKDLNVNKEVSQISVNCSENIEPMLVKSLPVFGIVEIDISGQLLIVKYSEFFRVFDLFGGDWKIEYEGAARYTKGFVLGLDFGKISVKSVKNGQTWEFFPNFSAIFHVDVVNTWVLAYNDYGFCRFCLQTRAYEVFEGKSLYKYFEIEDSGESVVLFSNSTAAVLVPDEIEVIGCEEIDSVCDNFNRIFILSGTKVFIVEKGTYDVRILVLGSVQRLIGCNENDCEIFVVDSDSISIYI